MEWKLTEGDSAPKIKKGRAKDEGALMLLLLLCGKKHLHTRSVCRRNSIIARTSMFTASDDISRMLIGPAYRSSLGTG